jgi:hypothetical protein
MSQCFLLGAGASYGYDDSLKNLQKPPLTDDLFVAANSLGLFPEDRYSEVYDGIRDYLKNKQPSASQEPIQKMNVEDVMKWLAEQFGALTSTLLPGPELDEDSLKKSIKYQTAIGKMFFLLFDLMRHYSMNYNPNFDNYLRLALHSSNKYYSVISLNYDVIFENALAKAGRNIALTLPVPVGNYVPIAKIHGSIAWLNPAGNAISWGRVRDENVLFSRVAQNVYSNRFNMGNIQIIAPRDLATVKMKDLLRSGNEYYIPILIPPLAGYKDYEQVELYKKVWELAVDSLKNAGELVLIGTTLRLEDERLSTIIRENVHAGTRVIAVGNREVIKSGLDIILKWKLENMESFPRFTDYAKTL